jgi:lipopolysaccharide export system ATP-binding protein
MNDVSTLIRPEGTAQVGSGLEVVSIAKSYDKRSVLHDISLTVGRGEVFGLLGPNGAGKTIRSWGW